MMSNDKKYVLKRNNVAIITVRVGIYRVGVYLCDAM